MRQDYPRHVKNVGLAYCRRHDVPVVGLRHRDKDFRCFDAGFLQYFLRPMPLPTMALPLNPGGRRPETVSFNINDGNAVPCCVQHARQPPAGAPASHDYDFFHCSVSLCIGSDGFVRGLYSQL